LTTTYFWGSESSWQYYNLHKWVTENR
jgi:hypothetical protein